MTDTMFDHALLEKRKALQDLGINPYPYSFDVSHNIAEIRASQNECLGKSVTIAGRIHAMRLHGKVYFADLQDHTDKIQIYVKRDKVGDRTWQIFGLLDVGDIIGVEGFVFTTKMGELTIDVHSLSILSKTAVRVPIQKSKEDQTWYQLSDPETIYRERYLQWITDEDSRKIVVNRAAIISEIRRFFETREFLEVTTPTIEMVYGGAEARPFETRIWALGDQKAFLRISPELWLKRFIVGGFPKVYTICQNFRNEGIDRTHNPEFTMMEWYEAYTDYESQMKLFEQLVEAVVTKVCGSSTIVYQGAEINFAAPWRRITMIDAIKRHTGFDARTVGNQEVQRFCEKNNIGLRDPFNKGLAISDIFDTLCVDKIIEPTFIIDHPKETSPLCKEKRSNPDLIERFEPYVCGTEIGNGYSELTDPVQQYNGFMEQAELRAKDEIKHHPMDLDFLRAISFGMPPTGGVGLGIDRLVMFVTNSASIRDVIAFPMMKPGHQ